MPHRHESRSHIHRPAIRDLVTLGQTPGDPEPLRDQKAMAVIAISGTMAVTVSYFLTSGRFCYSGGTVRSNGYFSILCPATR